MHDLALYEIDRSFHQVQGEWMAQDDFRPSGYSKERRTETLRIVAPTEELARALVESSNRTGFSEGEAVRIEEVRRFNLYGMVTRSW